MKCRDKAWLAGFIDGEGCIEIYSRKYIPSNSIYYIVRINISNTKKKAIEFIKKSYKKSCCSYIQYPISKNAKICYIAQFTCEHVIKVLNDVYPYLKLKREQARLCRKMSISISKNKRKKLSPNIIKYREKIYKKCQLINKRGLK